MDPYQHSGVMVACCERSPRSASYQSSHVSLALCGSLFGSEDREPGLSCSLAYQHGGIGGGQVELTLHELSQEGDDTHDDPSTEHLAQAHQHEDRVLQGSQGDSWKTWRGEGE